MTPRARQAWEAIYAELSSEQPGLLGSITARAEAQTIRLAMIYALLDRSAQIDAVHLTAALALWKYCADSARHILGESFSESDPAEVILRNLRDAGADGLGMREIHDLFSRHIGSDKLRLVLNRLKTDGKARCETKKVTVGPGRPRETWFAV